MKNLVYIIAALLIVSCGNKNSETGDTSIKDKATITGEVMYNESIALPPGSVLVLSLEDASKMDTASIPITKKTMVLNNAPPYNFKLDYPKNKIQDKFNYSLRAKIENNGKLLFTTTEHIDPFPSNKDDLKIVLQRVQNDRSKDIKTKTSSNTAFNMQDIEWTIETLNGATIKQDSSQKKPFIRFMTKDLHTSGFSGCNQFSGKYTIKGNELTFSPLASTKKACMKTLINEHEFLSALQNTHYFSITNNRLTLLSKNKKPLAVFKAQTTKQ